MKKFAFIQNGKVQNITEFKSLPPFHPSIEIVEITGTVPMPEEGWDYDGSLFSAPAKNLDYLKDHVKYIAQAKILALVPEWTPDNHEVKQRNDLARKVELLNKKMDASLSAEEVAELSDAKALWENIKAIRVASNLIEAELDNDINYDYANSPLWP